MLPIFLCPKEPGWWSRAKPQGSLRWPRGPQALPSTQSPEKRETPGSLLCPRRETKAVTSCKPTPLTPRQTDKAAAGLDTSVALGPRSTRREEAVQGGNSIGAGKVKGAQNCAAILPRSTGCCAPQGDPIPQPPHGCTVCPCASHVTPGLHCDPRASVSRPLHVTQTHR